MIGLILKDLYTIKRYSKILLVLIVFYIVVGYGMGKLDFVIFMIPFVTIMSVISTFSYDEFVKWDKYALSMPVSKKDMVLSKYVLTLLLIVVGGVFAAVLLLILSMRPTGTEINESLSALTGVMVASLIVIGIYIPLTYQFGTEKGRIIFPILVLAPSFGASYLIKNKVISLPSQEIITTYLKFLPILGIVFVIVSYFISLRIYSKKEW